MTKDGHMYKEIYKEITMLVTFKEFAKDVAAADVVVAAVDDDEEVNVVDVVKENILLLLEQKREFQKSLEILDLNTNDSFFLPL